MGPIEILKNVIYALTSLGSSLLPGATVTIRIDAGDPIVATSQGLVRGIFDSHGNRVFLGIPYAETTGGENRWTAPKRRSNHSNVFDAKSFGSTCPQAITGTSYTDQNEDCLNMNIWAPSNAIDLPVFVYIYGGAMVTGSSSNSQLQGNNFANNDVVYVTFNTRESIFASPFSSELVGDVQNFGILDVEFAIDWIYDNINSFGGNSSHIVLGGHSSGAVHVDHYLWNHPNTSVVGAIEMSANSFSGPGYAPENVGLDFMAAQVGCPNGIGQLSCLRTKSIYELETTSYNSSSNTWFTPTIDNITRFSPSNLAARFANGQYPSHVHLLTGNSNGEGTLFGIVYASENTNFTSWLETFDADSAHIPRDILLDAYNVSIPTAVPESTQSILSGIQYGDVRFDCATDALLALRASTQPTWAYRFFGAYDNVVGVANTAPTHGTEVPFFLGGNECFDGLSNVTVAQQELADSIFGWFVEWIKEPMKGPGWEKTSGNEGSLIKLGVPGHEKERILGNMTEYNSICRKVYNEYYKDYPVLINPVTGSIEDN